MLLRLQECLGFDAGLLEDGAKRSLGHVAGVVRDRCVPVQRWVKPDLMGARRLTVEFQAELFQALDDLAVAEPRELPIR